MAAGIWRFIDWLVNQDTAETIQQPQTESINLSYAASDEKIRSSTPFRKETHLFQTEKIKYGYFSRHHNRRASDRKKRHSTEQDW